MSKPATKKEHATAKAAVSNGQSLQERNDAAVQVMLERFTQKRKEIAVDKYFRALVKLGGSDLHMKVGQAADLSGSTEPSKNSIEDRSMLSKWPTCCSR